MLIPVTRRRVGKTTPTSDFTVFHGEYLDPLGIKGSLGIARRHLGPPENRDMFSGFDKFSRLEDNCFVDAG